MARFIVKKLPPHWLFVPSKRGVREFLDPLGVDVRCVVFHGTTYKPREARLSLGFIESRVVDKSFCFYLQFWGIPEALSGTKRESLSDFAIKEIERYILGRLSVRPTETVKPAQKTLTFKIDNDEILWSGRIKTVDRFAFSTGEWWVDPSAGP